jgi:hypothetical protein
MIRLTEPRAWRALGAGLVLGAALAPRAALSQPTIPWPPHAMNRPRPPAVTPAPSAPLVAPPSDAIVLFDGRTLSAWRSDSTAPAKWKVQSGYAEIVPGSGEITTRRAFGSGQYHIEWASPTPATGKGQDRGNSGVFLMGRYEIQVLDSYRSETYPDGQAGAVYAQHPPLVNASRPPGRWQSYDIIFHRPLFDQAGRLVRPARVTMFHNGVLVHDDVELTGPVAHGSRPPYEAHADRLPLSLQDHGTRVRFRNIWVREIPDSTASRR